MICPNCRESLPDGAVFCVNCGLRLSPAPQKAEPFRAPFRWPVVIPILMLVSFLISIAATVFDIRFYAAQGAAPIAYVVFAAALMLPLIAAVLFFTPTRRVPAVTSIPRLLALVLNAVSLVSTTATLSSAGATNALVYRYASFFITLAVIALYVAGCAAKPKSPAIALIHLVLMLVMCAASLLSFDPAHLADPDRVYRALFIASLLSAAAGTFSGAAYSIALFFTRRKYYTGE